MLSLDDVLYSDWLSHQVMQALHAATRSRSLNKSQESMLQQSDSGHAAPPKPSIRSSKARVTKLAAARCVPESLHQRKASEIGQASLSGSGVLRALMSRVYLYEY